MDHYDPDVITEKAFNKRFDYVADDDWKVPSVEPFTHPGSVVAGLEELKREVNAVKSSLNSYDIQKWNKHTNSVNPSGRILQVLRRKIQPELSTQAWCKFHELLSYGEVVPPSWNHLCSVHLCEAPGGFISSLNHYLRSNTPHVEHKWVGNTLNPYYEGNPLTSCIVDDRLIARTLKSWCFGEDNTGDVFKPGFIESLRQHCHQEFGDEPIGLVTADGSLSCADQPSRQEHTVAPLHHVEVFTALQLLCEGGSLVVKMFTMFEDHSASILFLLCCVFHQVSVFKPATSKAGNSEIYVVCRGYRGHDSWVALCASLNKYFPFQEVLSRGNPIFPPHTLPPSFMDQHRECVRVFSNHQTYAIHRNIHYYPRMSREDVVLVKQVQERVTQRFFDVCNLRRIKHKMYVVPSGGLQSGTVRSHIKQSARLEGSFSQRVLGKGSDMTSHSAENDFASRFHDDPEWIVMRKKSFWWNQSCVTTGKKLQVINSSLFCDTDVIATYQSMHCDACDETMDCESALLPNDSEHSHDDSNILNDSSALHNNSAKLSLTNQILEEDIQRIMTQHNNSALEIAPPCGESIYNEWMKSLLTKSNPHLTQGSMGLGEVVAAKPEIMHISMIPPGVSPGASGGQSWGELQTRCWMVEVVATVMMNLKKRGSCFIILPSVLTRLTAQCLWILSQCFEESMVHPVVIAQHPSVVLFIGTKYKTNPSYTHTLQGLMGVKLEPDVEVVELFPVSQVFALKSYFFESVRLANNACLDELSRMGTSYSRKDTSYPRMDTSQRTPDAK